MHYFIDFLLKSDIKTSNLMKKQTVDLSPLRDFLSGHPNGCHGAFVEGENVTHVVGLAVDESDLLFRFKEAPDSPGTTALSYITEVRDEDERIVLVHGLGSFIVIPKAQLAATATTAST